MKSVDVEGIMDPASRTALGWFWGRGLTAFEKSTAGPMLDRAELFGHGSVKCGRCRGAGIIDVPGPNFGEWCGQCHGTGTISAVRCSECGGDGNQVVLRSASNDGASFVEVDESSQEIGMCHHCAGSGWVGMSICFDDHEEDVRITGDEAQTSGYTPNEEALTRYAVISRRVQRLRAESHEVLRRLLGDAGTRCADAQARRLVAVYPMTTPGKKLVKLAINDMEEGSAEKYKHLPDYEQAFWQVAAQKTKPLERRGALIEASEREATELLIAAAADWYKTGGA